MSLTQPIEVTDADLAEYRDRGYWISPKVLTDEGIAVLRREVDRIAAGERDSDNYTWFEFPKPKPGTAQLRRPPTRGGSTARCAASSTTPTSAAPPPAS